MKNVSHRDPADWGRVAVLMGGHSAEREISLQSGGAVLKALQRDGVDAFALIWDDDLIGALREAKLERAFIALHGRGGEDGHVQAVLQLMGIPYTGSDVLGCALSMDKVRTKRVWQSHGLATPSFITTQKAELTDPELEELTYPVMVKPAREGSSFGASRVESEKELVPALEAALRYDATVLVEQWISGAEYTLGIVANQALPIIKLETPHQFYDYDAKYVTDTTRYICPCGLAATQLEEFTSLGMAAFNALGASGWGRVDFMLDEEQRPWLIELNTVPGMTDHSLVPMAAGAAGLSFDELVLRILATSERVTT